MSRHPSPRPGPLDLLSRALVLWALLCALGSFCLNTYLSPLYFYPGMAGSSVPNGAMAPIPLLPALAVCLGAGLMCAAVWALPRLRWLACLIWLAIAGCVIWQYWPLLEQGAVALWEALSTLFTDSTGWPGYASFALSLSPAQRQPLICAVLAAALCLYAPLLGWAVVRVRSFWLAFALTLPWLLPAFLAEIPLDWPALCLVCAGWAALLLSSLSARANPAGGGRIRLVSLPGCLAVLLAVTLLFPPAGYTQPQWAADAREELLALDWFSGGSPDPLPSDPLPSPSDGALQPSGEDDLFQMDFSSAGPRHYTGRTVLRLTSDRAGTIYLRGRAYGVYNGTSWAALPQQALDLVGNSASLLGLWQLATPGQFSTLTVTHPDGPTQLLYAPYQLIASPTQSVLPSMAADSVLTPAQSLEQYTLTYQPVSEDPVPADGDVSRFPQLNELYRLVVYGWYLDVPEELAAPLSLWYSDAQQQLHALGEPLARSGATYYAAQLDAAAQVLQVLAQTSQYDLNTPLTPAGEDFVTYFLTDSHRGYCVHFASAAVLLLRLQGIPARYVEGYVAQIPQAGQTVDVPDSNAHAWVELYLDGYGWYPVEVTPSAPAPGGPTGEEENTPTPSPTPQPTPSSAPQPTAPSSSAPQVSQSPAQDVGPAQPGAPFPVWLLWALAPLAVLAIPWIVWAIRRRQWQRMTQSGDTNAAVLAAYGWFTQLGIWGGVIPDQVRDLAQKARFSQHTLTQQERSAVTSALRREIARITSALPPWRRLPFRLLFCPGTPRTSPRR